LGRLDHHAGLRRSNQATRSISGSPARVPTGAANSIEGVAYGGLRVEILQRPRPARACRTSGGCRRAR
jgi:hypothetical protein